MSEKGKQVIIKSGAYYQQGQNMGVEHLEEGDVVYSWAKVGGLIGAASSMFFAALRKFEDEGLRPSQEACPHFEIELNPDLENPRAKLTMTFYV